MSKKILVIEDNDVVAKFLKSLLEKSGYQTVVLNQGGGAVEEIMRYKPDAILLDLLLPDMNGGDIVRELDNHPEAANTPIAILSAVIDKNDKAGGTLTIADKKFPAMSKSITGAELLAVVEKLVSE